MAEDPVNEEAKETLRFFKKGNGKGEGAKSPAADGAAEAVATEEPKEDAGTDGGTPAGAADGAKAESAPEAPKPQAREPEAAEGGPEAAAGPAEAGKPPRRRRGGKVAEESSAPAEDSVVSHLLPSLTLGFRTLVILAIVVADAFAAFMLTTKVFAPKLIESKVVELKAELGQVPPETTREKPKAKEKPGEGVVGSMFEIKDIVVNPAGTNGTRYLCTTVALEISNPLVEEEATAREAQVRDLLIEILGRRTVQELSSLEMRDYIRDEIQTSVNDLLTSGEIEGVYFSNFVLQ